jgi:Xaa-Pro aminopeptidase
MTPRRLELLRAQFPTLKIDAFMITFQPHLRYMSGFSGSSGMGIVTAEHSYLITDGRYASQVEEESPDWKSFITKKTLFDEARTRRLLPAGTRTGFDGNTLLYNEFTQIRKLFPRIKFLPKADTIERIAAVKDETEIQLLRRAVAITDQVFQELLPMMKPGVTELDIAAEISYRHRKHGAEGDAFESIVASGERGALPHGRATSKKFANKEMVTLDFGCVVEGYHSDMTRTVSIGKSPSEAKKIYAIVHDAQRKAIDAATAGIKTRDLDAVARGHIKKQGYDKFYRHSLGHGIGLQIHEPPRISVLSKSVLATGNVVTIEPGIYIPGFGGVRIEDDVIIRNGACEVLNRSPKEFITL